LLVLVPVLIFVTFLAPRLASRRVVAAPRRCVASCAGIRILSQGLAKTCVSELSVLPLGSRRASVGETEDSENMGFLAAICRKSQRWVALFCDAHLLSAD